MIIDQFTEKRDISFVEANNRMLSEALQFLIDYLINKKFILEDLKRKYSYSANGCVS